MLLKRYCLFFVCCSIVALASAQSEDRPQLRGGRPGAGAVSYDRQGRPIKNSAGKNDSLQTRNSLADSITIFYKHFDSTKLRTLDSSINYEEVFKLIDSQIKFVNDSTQHQLAYSL